MTDFKRGDRIRATATDTDGSTHTKTFWLNEDADGTLVTYHPFDPFCPVVPFEAVQAGNDGSLSFEVEVSAEDALPTEPGEYEDRFRYLAAERVRGTDEYNQAVADGTWLNDKPWVLEEDGGWTSPSGEHRGPEHAWELAVEGFEFLPWDRRDEFAGTGAEANLHELIRELIEPDLAF